MTIGRFQIVVWCPLEWQSWTPLFGFRNLAGYTCLSQIYSWALHVGPVEIRRWKRGGGHKGRSSWGR